MANDRTTAKTSSGLAPGTVINVRRVEVDHLDGPPPQSVSGKPHAVESAPNGDSLSVGAMQ